MNTDIYETGYKSITTQQAHQLICSLSCYTVIVDVRREAEYHEGHIKGSINIPLSRLEEKAEDILPDKSQEIILYCRTGSRSIEAANILLALGYRYVYDMGSIGNWSFGLER